MSTKTLPNPSSLTLPGNWTSSSPPPPELFVGDLVMYTGKVTEHSSFRRGSIYQVIKKKEPTDPEYAATYHFRLVFDMENPMGSPLDTVGFSTTREMKKLSLLDLATIRLHFDNFIREWAKAVGEADVDEVR